MAAPALPEPPSIPGTAPRVALYSARYEATAVADHNTLSIHLDRFATNAPVNDAQLTVEAGAARGPAERLPDGSYRFRHAAIDAPGPLALRLQVDEPGQPADLLAGTLRTGPADGAADDSHGHDHADGSHDGWLRPALWAAAALALIGAAVAVIRRLRRARRPHPTRTTAGDDAS